MWRGINFCLIFFICPGQHLQSSPDAQENIPPPREAIIINGKVNKGFNITQKKMSKFETISGWITLILGPGRQKTRLMTINPIL